MDTQSLSDMLNIKLAGFESQATDNIKKITIWRRKNGTFKVQSETVPREIVKDPAKNQIDAFPDGKD